MNQKRLVPGIAFLALFICLLLNGCAAGGEAEEGQLASLSDFNGRALGTLTGATYEQMMAQDYPDCSWSYYDDLSTQIAALKKGDVDALVMDSPVAELAAAQYPAELAVFPEPVVSCDFSMMLKKGGALTAPVSEIIRELRTNGTLDELKAKWLSGDEERMRIDWSRYDLSDRGNGVLLHLSTKTGHKGVKI